MKCFYDVELVDRGRELPLTLVSFGGVRDDGTELYIINDECLSLVMRHPWSAINLVPDLPIRSDDRYIYEWDRDHIEYPHVQPLDRLVDHIRRFLTETGPAELWAYYGDYKHVALCQLFGSVGERPPGIPPLTRDIQQLHEEHPAYELPAPPTRPGHAMHAARWVRAAHQQIRHGGRHAIAAEESHVLLGTITNVNDEDSDDSDRGLHQTQ